MASNVSQSHADDSGYRSTSKKLGVMFTFRRGLRKVLRTDKKPKPELYQQHESETVLHHERTREFREPPSIEEAKLLSSTGQLNAQSGAVLEKLPAERGKSSSRGSKVKRRSRGWFQEDFQHPDIILPPHPAFGLGLETQSPNSSTETTFVPSGPLRNRVAPAAAMSFACEKRSLPSKSSRLSISGASVRPVKPGPMPNLQRGTSTLAGTSLDSTSVRISLPAATSSPPAAPQASSSPLPNRPQYRNRRLATSASFAALRQFPIDLRKLRSRSRPCKPQIELPRLELELPPTDLTARSLFADLGYETPSSDEEAEGEAFGVQQETATKYWTLSDYRGSGQCKDPRLVRISSGRWFASRI
ncbi:hypothetical protein F5Y18DRAFT_435440 [Xylariaceae sp. FL1019]|nr:hypothetical protein F5Y18DRAFT_435440 [Xylariaceae sp. FL1019]